MTSALRGEGVPSKADIVSKTTFSKGGCVNLRTRGEGVKKSEIFADVINGSPLKEEEGRYWSEIDGGGVHAALKRISFSHKL